VSAAHAFHRIRSQVELGRYVLELRSNRESHSKKTDLNLSLAEQVLAR
jgi:hypothetical protein